MTTMTVRYVFFNNGADSEALQAARAVAVRCGAKVVGMLPRAVLLDVDMHRVPDIAAALTDWQFTPERRRDRERRQLPLRRAVAAEPAVALSAA